ncbi:hypothetical protein MM239_17265 [Belliella sp. DSM 111904]|uniref:Phage protein n=1 Tax=Belliella filtrata TaxID=2923435 RepID=A0ABS9V411_9BACT|nr:hypothetical protein [Belliella filtrata]MCH7411151.1 hypothetical protein [Belliella filtrata]
MIKLTPNDFWNLEDRELINVIDEFESYSLNKLKVELEENRLINYHIVAVQNSKIKRPNQLYKFNWEQKQQFLAIDIQSNLKLLGVPTRLRNKYKAD